MIIAGITLPSPEWSNSEAIISKVHYHRFMIGSVSSYVHAPSDVNRRKIVYQFSNIKYDVFQNLKAALLAAAGNTITIVDHNSITWTAHQTSNPMSMTWDARGSYVYTGEPGGCSQYTLVELNERGSFTFEFEGTHA
jgi:hypothetical protein